LQAKTEVKFTILERHLQSACAMPIHWSRRLLRYVACDLDHPRVNVQTGNFPGRPNSMRGKSRADTGPACDVQDMLPWLGGRQPNQILRPTQEDSRDDEPFVCLGRGCVDLRVGLRRSSILFHGASIEGCLTDQANRRPAAGAQPRMRDVRVERQVRRLVREMISRHVSRAGWGMKYQHSSHARVGWVGISQSHRNKRRSNRRPWAEATFYNSRIRRSRDMHRSAWFRPPRSRNVGR
jgi:hypothetical protein